MANPTPQQKRKGASLTGPIRIHRSRPHHLSETAPHISALSPITFGAYVTKNTTRVELSLTGDKFAADLFRAPYDGSIVAMNACASAALPTASSVVTIKPRINGVSQTGTLRKTLITGQQTTYAAKDDLTSYTYSAGDTLGVWVQSSNHDIGASSHVAVTLWIA
jgi:hypothetical protein